MKSNNAKFDEMVEPEVVQAVASAASAKAPKKAEVMQVGEKLVWTFAGGKVAEIELGKLTPEMLKAAALHGLKQTISDAYSGEKDSGTAYALAQVRIDTILGGSWTNRGTGVGSSVLQSDLIAAIMEASGKDVEAVTAVVLAMDAEKVKAIKKNPQVAAIMARLAAERLAKAAQAVDASLDNLFGGEV